MQRPGRARFPSLALALLLASCAGGPERFARGTADTGEMLQRINAGIRRDAVFVGEPALAEWFRAREEKIVRPRDRIRYADALLRVGDTGRAVALYAEVLDERRADGRPRLEPDVRADVERRLAAGWLRLAEQDNCIAHHTSASCVYPIADDGVHRMAPEGARRAVDAWSAVAARDPDDLQARWMLNLARMALGEHDRLPDDQRLEVPVDDAVRGLAALEDVAGRVGDLGVAQVSGGCVLDDFDGDGLIDVLASTIYPIDAAPGRVRLFRNRGDGRFEETTEAAGLAGVRGGLNMVQGDYDNDGDLDVFVLRGGWKQEVGRWPNTLLRNEGGGRFRDVTVAAGLLSFQPTQVACWGDFDRDGLLDLFVGNETGIPALMEDPVSQWFADFFLGVRGAFSPLVPAHLYRNRGDGTFEDVIADSGIATYGWIKGASWGDPDGDGWPDLYVSIWGRPNQCWRNLGKGRFEECAEELGIAGHTLSFASWFFDHDNDGDDDLFVNGFPYPELIFPSDGYPMELRWDAGAELGDLLQPGPPRAPGSPRTRFDAEPALYENRGGRFVEVTGVAGLERTMSTMGANFGDVDGDGWLDLLFGTGAPSMDYLVPNRLFLGRPGADGRRTYVDATIPLRFGHLQKGHAIGLADLDHDGDQDVYIVLGGAYPADVYPNALLANPGDPGHGMVTLELVGGPGTNRAALGAEVQLVVVEADGTRRSIHRRVGSGGSFGSSSLRLEIGVGPAVAVDRAVVVWPDRARSMQVHRDLEIGGHYRIRQGARAEALDRPRFDLSSGSGAAAARAPR